MRARIALCGLCIVGLVVAGCGPMHIPMVPRLEQEGQKIIDEAWDKALTPVDRYDNQALLDMLMNTHAYQYGVDKLDFRSEKKISAALVVMEIRYDRLVPEMDYFHVTILNAAGDLVRKESYGREQVETTYQDLFVNYPTLKRRREDGTASAEDLKRLEEVERRLARVEQVFPKIDDLKAGKDNAGKTKEK